MALLRSFLLACLLAIAIPLQSLATNGTCLPDGVISTLRINVYTEANETYPVGYPVYSNLVEFDCQHCPVEFGVIADKIQMYIDTMTSKKFLKDVQKAINGKCCSKVASVKKAKQSTALISLSKRAESKAKLALPTNSHAVQASPAPLALPDLTIAEILLGHRFQKVDPTCSLHPSIEDVYADEIAASIETANTVIDQKPPQIKKTQGIIIIRRAIFALFDLVFRVWCAVAIAVLAVIYFMYLWLFVTMLYTGGLPGHRVINYEANLALLSSGGYDADDEETFGIDETNSEVDVTMDDVSQSHA